MLDVRHWNFSQPARISGKAIILGHDMVAQARQVRQAHPGPLILLLPRQPSASEILGFPRGNCVLVCEAGDRHGEEFQAAVSSGIFYANGAQGAIGMFRAAGLVALDLLALDAERMRLLDDEVRVKADGLSATGDAGQGLSERQEFLLGVAGQLSKARHYEHAERYYEQAEQASGGHPTVLNNRGGNYTRWGRLADAERSYRRCLERDPSHGRARKNLGDVLLKLGKLPAAQEQYEAALQIDDTHASAWYGLGLVHLEREDAAEAERCLRQAVYCDPANALAWLNLGACLLMQQKLTEALHAYSEAQVLDPAIEGVDVQLDDIRARMAP